MYHTSWWNELGFSYPTTPHDTGIRRSVVLYCGLAVWAVRIFSPVLSRTKNTIFVSFTAFSQRKLLLSDVTGCTWETCILWRQRTNFTAQGCSHEKLYKCYGEAAKPAEEATNAGLASVLTLLIFLRTKRKERRLGEIWQLYKPKLHVNRFRVIRIRKVCESMRFDSGPEVFARVNEITCKPSTY